MCRDQRALEQGLKTAFIDAEMPSDEADRPRVIANNKVIGADLLSAIRTQLNNCDSFDFCVAFIGESGFSPWLTCLLTLGGEGSMAGF